MTMMLGAENALFSLSPGSLSRAKWGILGDDASSLFGDWEQIKGTALRRLKMSFIELA